MCNSCHWSLMLFLQIFQMSRQEMHHPKSLCAKGADTNLHSPPAQLSPVLCNAAQSPAFLTIHVLQVVMSLDFILTSHAHANLNSAKGCCWSIKPPKWWQYRMETQGQSHLPRSRKRGYPRLCSPSIFSLLAHPAHAWLMTPSGNCKKQLDLFHSLPWAHPQAAACAIQERREPNDSSLP